MKVLIVIPARFESTRFPGKPLVKIGGKTMIQRVYEQAHKIKGFSLNVVVATDDERIANEVNAFGGKVCMTSTYHESGTARCFEAALKQDEPFDLLLNIQGDEPFINPEPLQQLLSLFKNEELKIASMMSKLTEQEEILNPNRVKVVTDKDNKALYFSRSPIPYKRGEEDAPFFKHIGVYAFLFIAIPEIMNLEQCKLEQTEALEQLRWLYHGFKIKMLVTDEQGVAVDSPGDLKAVEKYLKSNPEFI